MILHYIFALLSLQSYKTYSANISFKLKMNPDSTWLSKAPNIDFKKYRFILGSGSPTRRLILSQLGISFTVLKASIDEKSIGDRGCGELGARNLVLTIASSKAYSILKELRTSANIRNQLLLTADQVVVSGGRILEKPRDEYEFRSFLDGYYQQPCKTVGSIIITDVHSGTRVQVKFISYALCNCFNS